MCIRDRVYKYNTNDTSIANDYFNKPAKYIKKNGKLYVQITVNHSHWTVSYTHLTLPTKA
ncbi:hypothetical protein JMUB7529_28250 [Staphylococcus aureus]